MISGRSFSVGQVAKALDVALIGDPETRVSRIAAVESAGPESITFITGPGYLEALNRSQAAAVIVPDSLSGETSIARLISSNPYLCYAQLTRFWVDHTETKSAAHVHASAAIDPSAILESGVSVGASVTIEAGASVKANAKIGAGSFVGAGVCVGSNTVIHPNVTIMHGVTIGDGCEVHAGAVIGADGFGWAPSRDGWEKIHQLGGVRVGDRVSIGACTTVDRGALDDTVIGDGVILDNHIQVAHNVTIGENTAIAGCTGIAGSTHIGRGCRIGGAVSIVGHISICDNVLITANSFVNRSVKKPGSYSSGFPLEESATWRKNAVRLRKLDEFIRGLRKTKH